MHRRFHLFWIPLLATLLTAPMGRRAPVWAPGSAVGDMDPSPAFVGLVRPIVRFQPAPQAGSPADRHGGLPWPMLPATAATVVVSLVAEVATRARSGQLAETTRQFPLFPTGPPSRG